MGRVSSGMIDDELTYNYPVSDAEKCDGGHRRIEEEMSRCYFFFSPFSPKGEFGLKFEDSV